MSVTPPHYPYDLKLQLASNVDVRFMQLFITIKAKLICVTSICSHQFMTDKSHPCAVRIRLFMNAGIVLQGIQCPSITECQPRQMIGSVVRGTRDVHTWAGVWTRSVGNCATPTPPSAPAEPLGMMALSEPALPCAPLMPSCRRGIPFTARFGPACLLFIQFSHSDLSIAASTRHMYHHWGKLLTRSKLFPFPTTFALQVNFIRCHTEACA